jgi:hypothetical protein
MATKRQRTDLYWKKRQAGPNGPREQVKRAMILARIRPGQAFGVRLALIPVSKQMFKVCIEL